MEPAADWLRVIALSAAVASVHLWRARLEVMLNAWRDTWMPLTGGFALGYVAVYLLPKLGAKHQSILLREPDAPLLWQFRTYLVVLVGAQLYLVFLNLRQRGHAAGEAFGPLVAVGRISYSFLGGYLLVEFPADAGLAQTLAALVLVVHLIGLESHLHGRDDALERRLRVVLVAAVMAGTLTGLLYGSAAFTAPLTALLAGGILAVVLTDEVPSGTQRLGAFVAGSIVFVAIAAIGRAHR